MALAKKGIKMISDGYWKLEIKKSEWILLGLQRLSRIMHSEYLEHRMNKHILLTAAIVRKIIEDEISTEEEYKKSNFELPTLKMQSNAVDAYLYHFAGDEKWILHKVIVENYKRKCQKVRIETRKLCNCILHSYIWTIAYVNNRIGGFLVASDFDKEKGLYYIPLRSWCDVLEYCIDNSNI